MRSSFRFTLLLGLLFAPAALPGSWRRTLATDGRDAWRMQAEGRIELSPDGREVLSVSPDALLVIERLGPRGAATLRITAGPDGLPSFAWTGLENWDETRRLEQALRTLVVAYWASEPSEGQRILRSAGGAFALAFRQGWLREAWCRQRGLTSCEFSRARVQSDWPRPDGIPLEGSALERRLVTEQDSFALARVDWLKAQVSSGSLRELDVSPWLARQAVGLARSPSAADAPHDELFNESLELFRSVLRRAPAEPLLTLAFTWMVTERPGSSRRGLGDRPASILLAGDRLLASSRHVRPVPGSWRVGTGPLPDRLVDLESWQSFLFAVPRSRRMDETAWKDWLDGLDAWSGSPPELADMLHGAIEVAPAEDWAHVGLVAHAGRLAPRKRWEFLLELAFLEAAGSRTLRAALESSNGLQDRWRSWGPRELDSQSSSPVEPEEMRALRSHLLERLEALTEPKATPAKTSAPAR